MYNRLDNGFIQRKFVARVKDFIEFAKANCTTYNNEGMIKCPCHRNKCRLLPYFDVQTVEYHICRYGFIPGYYCWY
ncbi:hypothetical protein Syun_021211 [Stephania yunnanensis]|uniref:Transposase-associated domain-containing protein n=1 Tax=Stephania yunnanensis TaxID=152371 RepID=A0AAP0NQH4_9MAGN